MYGPGILAPGSIVPVPYSLHVWRFGAWKNIHTMPGMTADQVRMWSDISAIGWIGLSPVFFWYILVLTGRSGALKFRWFLWSIVAAGMILVIAEYKGLMFSEYILMPYGWTFRWSKNLWAQFILYRLSFTALVSWTVINRLELSF